MSTPRHRAREVALQFLYRHDLAQQSGGELSVKTPNPTPKPQLSPEALVAELKKHFDHFQVSENLREFAAQLVAGTLQEMPKLDVLIESHASNWKLSRMSSVDRTLLRMASYELSNLHETDASVVIDEAIELGKEFGTAETSAFVNGILDAVKTSLARAK
jgi:N utilization substance protein B